MIMRLRGSTPTLASASRKPILRENRYGAQRNQKVINDDEECAMTALRSHVGAFNKRVSGALRVRVKKSLSGFFAKHWWRHHNDAVNRIQASNLHRDSTCLQTVTSPAI